MNKLLPHGCDQKSRYPTREWPVFPDTVPGIRPMPAEACTDLGADDEPEPWPWHKGTLFIFAGVALFWLGIPALWHLGSRLIAHLTT